MKKKPRKVEESAAPYAGKKQVPAAGPVSSSGGAKRIDDAAFQKVADKIFAERKELLRRLAQ